MNRLDMVASYLNRIQQVRDELAVVGEAMSEDELVKIALSGFSKEWDTFVIGILTHDKLLDWNRLLDDFTQKEI